MTRPTQASNRLQRWADVAAALAVTACYGTLAVVSLLSLLGFRLALHPGAWASAIAGFVILTFVLLVLSYRRHRSPGPLLLAGAATALILWVMFGAFDRILELSGFAALIGAVFWNRQLTRGNPPSRPLPRPSTPRGDPR